VLRSPLRNGYTMGWDQGAIDALLRLTRKLLEPITLEQALVAVTDAALNLLPGDHASVRILDDSGTRLLCSARSGEGSTVEPVTFRPGEGVVGWVVQQGKQVRIDDAQADERFKPAPAQGFEIRSILAAPLWATARVVGVLGVTAAGAGRFGAEDETMALLLANCAAPTIERARLEHLTVTDELTMAFNQRYLFPRLNEEVERARRLGTELNVLCMDLDHFKRVNDQHGHTAGDRVLQGFADRVRSMVRLSDVLIRRGGDEFVLIMPNLPQRQVHVAAERIRHGMARDPLDAGEQRRLTQTVSIGAARWDGRESPRELEARGDGALYEAKRRGRNRVVLAGEPSLPPAGSTDEDDGEKPS
jgi:diguanylate cyclase (GGDEF)-like protein